MAAVRKKRGEGASPVGGREPSLPPMPPAGMQAEGIPGPGVPPTSVFGSVVMPSTALVPPTDPLDEFFLDAQRDGVVSETEAATIVPAERAGELERVLLFGLGGEVYGLGIMGIREILKPVVLTEVPRAPENVMGVFSLRGHVMPLLALTGVLGVGGSFTGAAGEARILVAGQGDESVAFWVHRVAHVVKMNTAQLEPPPVGLPPARRALLRGLGRAEEGLVILLDLDNLLVHLGVASPRDVEVA